MALVQDQTPLEFFREQLERAMDHQKVSTSEFTEYYLVNLLAGCLRRSCCPASRASTRRRWPSCTSAPSRPPAVDRAKLLRAMGDTALFVSGFFADSLSRRLVDLDYYKAMGGLAYARLAQDDGPAHLRARGLLRAVRAASPQFADLLSEVSEKSHLSSLATTSPSSGSTSAGSRRAAGARRHPGRAGNHARHRRSRLAVSAAGIAGLLVDVQRRLEALYALEHQAPVTDFLIPAEAAGDYPGGGSRTLLTQEGGDVPLGVVLEDVRERLARRRPARPPRRRRTSDPFCMAAEEVSHFVYLFFCARGPQVVTQLELELQGEVDKYLSAVFLISLQNEGAVSPAARAAVPPLSPGRPRHRRRRRASVITAPATSPIATAGTWSRIPARRPGSPTSRARRAVLPPRPARKLERIATCSSAAPPATTGPPAGVTPLPDRGLRRSGGPPPAIRERRVGRVV